MIRVKFTLSNIEVEISGTNPQEIISQIDSSQFLEMIDHFQKSIHATLDERVSNDPNRAEFVQKSKANSVSDKAILSMAYVSMYENVTIFNKIDVENFFFEIHEAIPTNTNAVLNSLEKQGLLVRHRDKKQGLLSFYLTQKGLDYAKNLRMDDNDDR